MIAPHRLAPLAIALLAAGATPVVAALTADQRVHRLHALPVEAVTPIAPPIVTLAKALSVDEVEWALRPTRLKVAAGQVELNVYNRGMDDHDLAVYGSDGRQLAKVDVPSGESRTINPTLAAGQYRIVCSLFAGTASSHEALGMRFTLAVE